LEACFNQGWEEHFGLYSISDNKRIKKIEQIVNKAQVLNESKAFVKRQNH
jgi:hypothetical protein